MSEFDPNQIYPTATPPPPKQKEGLRTIITTILFLLAPLALGFLVILPFVIQSYEVDGPSMQSTLQDHDRIILLKVPRTIAKITHHPYIPSRGDIIIFNHSEQFGLGTGPKKLVKRVIGLPGERVVVKDGAMTVFNSAHPEGFSPDKTMAYGKVIGSTAGDVDLKVPANEIFVCGDNRANSLDSRYFGSISVDDIVGKVSIRIYPFNHAGSF